MTDTGFLTIRWIDAFGAGIYVLTALTQFDLWLHRRDRPTHLWLGLSAVGALLVNLSGQIIRTQRPEIQHWPLVINLFGVVLALISLFELVQAITHRRSSSAVRALQSLAILLVLGVTTLRYYPLQPALHLLSLGFLLLAMARAIGDGLRGDIEARSLAIGLIVLLATLIFDILGAMGVLPRLEGLPVFGFALLFLAAARALSMRYDREYRELVASSNET